MFEGWHRLIVQIDWFVALWAQKTEILLFVIFIFLLIIVFAFFIYLFKKQSNKIRQKLIYQYDNIFYLISWYNYQTNTSDWLEMMMQVLDSKNPSYEDSHSKIFKSVQEIESSFGKKIIPQNDWKIIKRLRSQLGILLFCNKVLKILLFLFVIWAIVLFVYNKN